MTMRELLVPRRIGAALLTLGLAGPLAAQIHFQEVGAAAGVVWNHVGEQMSGGCAVLDGDADGRLDVVLVGGTGAPGVFRNTGGLTFVDVSAASGMLAPPPGEALMGISCADVDADFRTDAFVTAYGRNVLYRGTGPLKFTDATAAAGLDGPNSALWSSCAGFADYDMDGDLDLFVGNYVLVPSQPTPDLLYRNDGGGTFTDVTAITLGASPATYATALACQWTDFDDDGDVDLMLGNDLGAFLKPNRLYRNDGPAAIPGGWSFADVAPLLGADAGMYTMGVHGGDYDRDGDIDYYVTNIGRKLLLQNDGPSGFSDVTAQTGTEGTFDAYQPGGQTTSWSLGFHDFDADGWLDLFVSHGYTPPPSFVPSAQNVQNAVNQLFRHDGPALTFTNVASSAGVEDPGMGRGAAFGDLDQDGDVDIVQVNVDGPARVFRNDSAVAGNHCLALDLRGRLSHREALGARVTARAAGVTWVRDVVQHYGYLSTSEHAARFGLGTTATVDDVEIRWPSGIQQHRYRVAAGATLPVKEPYLTFDPTSSYTPAANEGQILQIQPVLRNHTTTPRNAWLFAEIRVGPVLWITPIFSFPIPAQGTTTVPFPIPVPLGVTGGVPLAVELTWNLYDASLGHDQWRNDVTLAP